MKERIKTGTGWPHDVTKNDLKIVGVRGSGPGGQHKNKTETGVLMTHIPTGISVRSTDSKSRIQNTRSAFRKLAEILVPMMREAVGQELRKDRNRAGIERIRTYHEKDQRVKDVRTDVTFDYDTVLEGNGLQDIVTTLKLTPQDD